MPSSSWSGASLIPPFAFPALAVRHALGSWPGVTTWTTALPCASRGPPSGAIPARNSWLYVPLRQGLGRARCRVRCRVETPPDAFAQRGSASPVRSCRRRWRGKRLEPRCGVPRGCGEEDAVAVPRIARAPPGGVCGPGGSAGPLSDSSPGYRREGALSLLLLAPRVASFADSPALPRIAARVLVPPSPPPHRTSRRTFCPGPAKTLMPRVPPSLTSRS